MFHQKILICTDLSPASLAAIDKGAAIAHQFGASVLLIYIYDPALLSPFFMLPGGAALAAPKEKIDEFEQGALDGMKKIQSEHLQEIKNVELLIRQHYSASDGICNAAKEQKADLLVIGTHGRTGLNRTFLGSVAERVVRYAPCPVLTVRADPE